MELTREQFKELHHALIMAFVERSFRRMLKLECGWDFDHICEPGNFADRVFEAIEHAQRESAIAQLILGAQASTQNQLVQTLSFTQIIIQSDVPAAPKHTRPKQAFLIDRIDAVALFEQMMRGELGCCVLSVVGAAEMGKTRLMQEYYQRAGQFARRRALVPLESHYNDPTGVLNELVKQLGRQHFATYWAKHNALAQTATDPSEDLATLLTRLSAQSNRKPAKEQMRTQQLMNAFLADLRKLIDAAGPIVFLLDAVEQAAEAVKQWVHGELLPELIEMRDAWVVLAGRQLPEPDFRWEAQIKPYELAPVSVEHYREYCTALNLALTEDNIKAFHHAFGGKPGSFAKIAPSFQAGWGQA